jgi:hypothetical protein
MLITYFREFPTLSRGSEPPYGRWLDRSFVDPLAEELGLASPRWQAPFGKRVLRILSAIAYRENTSRVSTLSLGCGKAYGHDQASIAPPLIAVVPP